MESVRNNPNNNNKDESEEDTVRRSHITHGNKSKTNKPKTTKNKVLPENLEEQIEYYKEQMAVEKAGKRKLFHSLVKLANELRRTRDSAQELQDQREFQNKQWYEGGLWRAPTVLPGVSVMEAGNRPAAISLSDLFFNLVTVTAFTRVGVAISQQGFMTLSSLLYFAIFWTVWSKEASYATRFDTSDLSAQLVTLITCFALLFASLSAQAPMTSNDGTRIMIMATAVAVLHAMLHLRVYFVVWGQQTALSKHIRNYATLNILMNLAEAAIWIIGIVVLPVDWEYRWAIFTGGVLFALRVPRAFLANDFHAACSKRGVLFILLLGFLLQSMVVVASEFFEYQSPSLEDYGFLGAACLMFFCIKLLYVDDSVTVAEDHALLVNRWAGFFFNLGQFSLLLSTTVMGSGLNLLTHSYLAATAALPGPAKNLVTGGFAAVLLSNFFIKSMHLKRIPTDRRNQALFLSAYAVQSVVLLGVVGVAATMCYGDLSGGFLAYLMNRDIELLFFLSGAAFLCVVMSWLDEGVELALYASVEDSRSFRVHPFGFWSCLKPEVTDDEITVPDPAMEESSRNLSVLSPLLGSSAADLKKSLGSYNSMSKLDDGV